MSRKTRFTSPTQRFAAWSAHASTKSLKTSRNIRLSHVTTDDGTTHSTTISARKFKSSASHKSTTAFDVVISHCTFSVDHHRLSAQTKSISFVISWKFLTVKVKVKHQSVSCVTQIKQVQVLLEKYLNYILFTLWASLNYTQRWRCEWFYFYNFFELLKL